MGEQSGACELPGVEARTLGSPAGVPFDCDLRNRVANQSRVPAPFPRGNAEFLSPCNFIASIASPIVKLQRDTPRRANCCSDWWIAHFGTRWRNVLERREVSRDIVTFRGVLSLARILSRIVAVINVALFTIDIYQRIPGYRWKRCG